MKIKNILYWLFTIIQIALALIAACIYYLSNEKMGVMRSLIYRNEIYDKFNLNIKMLYGLLFMLLVLIIVAVKMYKGRSKLKYSLSLIGMNLLIIIFSVYFNATILISYYVLLVSFTVMLILQLGKLILYL